MNSDMSSPGAAAASYNMKDSGGMKRLNPPLYFMLQLAAAAPGLFMPPFMLLLKFILLKILIIQMVEGFLPTPKGPLGPNIPKT